MSDACRRLCQSAGKVITGLSRRDAGDGLPGNDPTVLTGPEVPGLSVAAALLLLTLTDGTTPVPADRTGGRRRATGSHFTPERRSPPHRPRPSLPSARGTILRPSDRLSRGHAGLSRPLRHADRRNAGTFA